MPAAQRREVIERAATEVFAERGYRGASMDEIARRSGVSVPVLYDHFASKPALHRRLLERTRDELLAMWRETLGAAAPAEERVPVALAAWAAYVETHPFAARMYFRETTGDLEAEAAHRAVQAPAGAALTALLAREVDAGRLTGSSDPRALEMASELIRSALTGLAVWWSEHPEITREQIVTTAVNVLWTGLSAAAAPAGASAAGRPGAGARPR